MRFVYQDNIAPQNQYGIIGNGTGPGKSTLTAYFPDAVVRRNVIPGAQADLYPEDNFFPPSLAQVGFINLPSGDYRLAPNSPYKHAASDGKDPGADFQNLPAQLTASARVPDPSDQRSAAGASRRPAGIRGGAVRLLVGLALVVIAAAAIATASAARQRGQRHA